MEHSRLAGVMLAGGVGLAAEHASQPGFDIGTTSEAMGGSIHALATDDARRDVDAPDPSPQARAAELVAWITEHEQDLGLAPGLGKTDVTLTVAGALVPPLGALALVRYHQRYRAWRVLPPDDVVQVVYRRAGALEIMGRIVDGRIDFAYQEAQAPLQSAHASILHYAELRAGVPTEELAVDDLSLFAMPESQQIVWMGNARRATGTAIARVIVSADPHASDPLLPLLGYEPLVENDVP